MFGSLRVAVLAITVAVLLAGVLIGRAIINATSPSGDPSATSATAIAIATRSLPAYWVVRAGDTFTSVSAANHLSETQLQQLNPAQDPSALIPGQHLMLHVQPPVRPTPKRVLPSYWVVHRGETYTSIAAKLGLAATYIQQSNPAVNPNLLKPGQRLKLRP